MHRSWTATTLALCASATLACSSHSPANDGASVPPAAVGIEPVLRKLDAMLDEINAHWRTDQSQIFLPHVTDAFDAHKGDGVPVLVPAGKLPLADVTRHLAKRAGNVKNDGLKMYTGGSLVPIESSGQRVGENDKPAVLALNETLLLFVEPSPGDPTLLGRIMVARP